MNALRKLRNIMAAGVRFLGRYSGETPVPGFPEGISFEELAELCLQQQNEPLRQVSYLHLSGWKLAGTYRLLLETKRGRRWSLIYKNAVYNARHFPGLAGFPARLGPPEHLVYSSAQGALARYLPAVYRCSESLSEGHYRYLLEDLSHEYAPASLPEETLRAAAELPALHRALSRWLTSVDQTRLVRYDGDYLAGFLEYASQNLQRYALETREETVAEVCRLWPRVSQLCVSPELQELEPLRPIHGDFSLSNILIHRKSPGRIKLIDWEWVGVGVAHMDVAVLLKRATPEVEQRGLQIFAEYYNHLSLAEHQRLYEWCKLRWGLLDSAYGAAHEMGSRDTTGIDLRSGIVAGARQVLRSTQALTQVRAGVPPPVPAIPLRSK